jgi:type IV secretion system protein VirB1
LKRFYEKAERELGSGQDALKAALSAYNTGNGKAGFENGYVAKFYGRKVAYKANPFSASMVPAESNEPAKAGSKATPYTISMVPNQGSEGEEDAEAK